MMAGMQSAQFDLALKATMLVVLGMLLCGEAPGPKLQARKIAP